MRRIFGTLVAVLVVAVFATFITSTSASAAESDAVVPPAALVGCDTYRPGGGWDDRDIIGDGTTGSNADLPVRPKHLRLGEPCVQQNPGGPDFYIPMLVTDVPIEGDVGELPESDGFASALQVNPACPELTLHGSFFYAGSSCSAPESWYGVWRIDVDFRDAGREVDVSITRTVGTGAQGGQFVHWYCYTPPADPGLVGSYVRNVTRYTESSPAVLAAGWPGAGNLPVLNQTYTRTFTCPEGSIVARVFNAATLPVDPWAVQRGWWDSVVPGHPSGGMQGGTGYFDGTQGAHFSIGPRLVEEPPPASKMFCRTDFSDAGTGSDLAIEFAMDWPTFFGSTPVLDVEGNVTDWSFRAEVLLMLPAVEDCTYLEAIELHVCAALGIGFGVFACSVHTWTVDRWMSNRPYSDDSPELELCQQYPTRPECVPILFPPFIDPIDFAVVCADPPSAAWESWDWLGPFFAHFAECLFVPQGGFDRHGQIAASWNASAGGALAASAQAVLDAFYFEGTCGPLFASVDIGGAPMTINTCSWGWAGGLKIALYWIVLLLGMWRALSFAISLIQSAIGATPAPTPIGSDD